MMMNILLVSLVFDPTGTTANPGVNRYATELASTLQECGAHVEVATPLRPGQRETGIWRGIRIFRICDTKTIFGSLGVVAEANVLAFDLALARQRDLFADIDVVQSDIPLPHSRAYLGDTPLVALVHHAYRVWRGIDVLTVPFGNLYQRISLRSAAAVVVPSQATADDAEQLYGVPSHRITRIPHGIDRAFLRAGELSLGRVIGNPPSLVYVGVLEKRKGVLELPHIVTRVRERFRSVTLEVVGTGPDEGRLKAEFYRLGLEHQVHFLHDLSDAELIGTIRGCDVFVFPSHQEGFGFAVVEAMALGVPVVAYDTPSMRETVGEGGILVQPEEPDAIARIIVELLGSPERLRALGMSGHSRAATGFDWVQSALHYMKVYRRAMSE